MSQATAWKVHLLSLPRWFGLPVVLSSVALGGLLAGVSTLALALALAVGAFLMAYAHSVNSWYDYIVTGFDRGTMQERSRGKPYTGAQNLLAEGRVSPRAVVVNSLVWLLLAAITAIPLAWQNPGFWWPFIGIALCAPAYSEAKKLWLCEVVLGLGFGPLAVALGAAASPGADLGRALLAGIPLALMFGFAAETVDQALDAPMNAARGLRNLGMLAWRHRVLVKMLGAEIAAAYISLVVLVLVLVLSWWAALLALVAFPPLAYCTVVIEARPSRGIKVGLVGVFLFGALITTGQGLGG